MFKFQRHLFVCTNRREPGHPKGCCAEKGSETIREMLKDEIKRLRLQSTVRANIAGCLDACECGPTIVVYPEGVWYGGVKPEDVREIVDRHILKGEVVERLVIPDPRPMPGGVPPGSAPPGSAAPGGAAAAGSGPKP
jgi:(2Fe-2S) ferredoxin